MADPPNACSTPGQKHCDAERYAWGILDMHGNHMSYRFVCYREHFLLRPTLLSARASTHCIPTSMSGCRFGGLCFAPKAVQLLLSQPSTKTNLPGAENYLLTLGAAGARRARSGCQPPLGALVNREMRTSELQDVPTTRVLQGVGWCRGGNRCSWIMPNTSYIMYN